MIFDEAYELELILSLESQQLIEQLGGRRHTYKRVYVDIGECGHYDLTVESVHEAAMARYSVAEVFYLESALKTAGKKAAERSYSRREYGQSKRMHLKRMHVDLETGHEPGHV